MQVDERLVQMEDRLTERMRDMQTEILRVFIEFQQRNQSRDTALERSLPPLTDRLSSVERRWLEIEKKLLLNPPAA